MPSWDFFDLLLQRANVVTTPGAGFGPSGEGYIRLTGFGGAEDTAQAVERIKLATRRYAKRQRTWFRKDARIRWLDATSRDIPSLVEEALELLDDGVA